MDLVYDLDVTYSKEPTPGWFGSGKIMLGPFETQSAAASKCREIIALIGEPDDTSAGPILPA